MWLNVDEKVLELLPNWCREKSGDVSNQYHLRWLSLLKFSFSIASVVMSGLCFESGIFIVEEFDFKNWYWSLNACLVPSYLLESVPLSPWLHNICIWFYIQLLYLMGFED